MRSTWPDSSVDASLNNSEIAGAGLDVFCGEPAIDSRFPALDNVVPRPHHGGGKVGARHAMGQLVRDDLEARVAGRRLPAPVI